MGRQAGVGGEGKGRQSGDDLGGGAGIRRNGTGGIGTGDVVGLRRRDRLICRATLWGGIG